MLSRRDVVGRLAAGTAVAAWAAATSRHAGAALAPGTAPGRLPDNGTSSPQDLQATGPLPQATVELAAQRDESVPAEVAAQAPPPWELLRPLTAGVALGHGWRLTELSGPRDGACVLALQNDRGRVQRVHLCRNDGRPQGLVYTREFDLVVMNGGRGDLGTEEGLGQAVATVAHALAANEGSGQDAAVAIALLPHGERLRCFADANEWTLR
jgi:hypothetical protein